jgi:teichoic acid transport system permease protein
VSKRGRLSAPGDLATDGAGRRGSLSGPGSLSTAGKTGTATALAPPDEQPWLPPGDETLTHLAARYGLRPSAARPPVWAYLRQLWQRRHFIVGFATARTVAMYTEAKLGQLWQVLTPLLNAAVYYLIFGLLLGTSRGVPDFVSYLVAGIFVFNFTQRSFLMASRVIRDSLPLIRALHFPRACLPLGYVIIELQQLLISFAVLFAIVLVRGEPVTWHWLLIIPALLLQTLFNIGAGLLLARWGAGFDDVSQLLPFLLRTWLYASGVIFSIQAIVLLGKNKYLNTHHPTLIHLLQINPAAVYITLVRNALLTAQPGSRPFTKSLCEWYKHNATNPKHPGAVNYIAYCHPIVGNADLWLWGAGWALAALVVGFFVFWRAETRYGRG